MRFLFASLFKVVTDGHEKCTRKHCKACYKVGSYSDSYCIETPLQGSYYCLVHNLNSPLDNGPPNYDGDRIFNMIFILVIQKNNSIQYLR